MSGGHFAGLLTPLMCRGSKGQTPHCKFRNSPKAGSGAEWLATLRNLPVICRHNKDFLNVSSCGIFQNRKRLMMVVLWCGKRLWRKSGLLPFAEYSSFLEQAFHTPLRCEVPDNPMPYPAYYPFLTFFSALSATLLLIHFLFSVTKHKNSSHNHFLNFLLRKCHHC